jgi:hypothetical protein
VNGYPAVANRVSKLSISPGYISEIPLNLALKKWEAVEISELVEMLPGSGIITTCCELTDRPS